MQQYDTVISLFVQCGQLLHIGYQNLIGEAHSFCLFVYYLSHFTEIMKPATANHFHNATERQSKLQFANPHHNNNMDTSERFRAPLSAPLLREIWTCNDYSQKLLYINRHNYVTIMRLTYPSKAKSDSYSAWIRGLQAQLCHYKMLTSILPQIPSQTLN